MEKLEKVNTKGWETKQRCTGKGNGERGCGEQILVTKDDIDVTSRGYYKSCKEYYYTFRCPKCGRNTNISGKYIPEDIKNRAMEEYRKMYMD